MENEEYSKENYLKWINGLTENLVYNNPAIFGDTIEIPIVASGIMYMQGGNLVPLKNFEVLRECGFNLCLGDDLSYYTLKDNYQNAADAKVKMLAWYGGFINPDECGVKGWVSSIDEAGFGGIKLCDEPSLETVRGGNESVHNNKSLWELYYDIKKVQAVEYLAFINLVAISEDPTKENTIDYLNDFQTYFKPALFSYDLYPIKELSNLLHEGFISHGIQEGSLNSSADEFYYNLEKFSEISKKHSRPFWAFCQSMSMFVLGNSNYYPIALEQYLRFEAFSALAYGAKGIVYWTYNMRETGSAESYLSSLLNRRGEKTASWYFAQKVNQEIHKYSFLFLNAKHKDAHLSNNYSYRSSNPDFKFNITTSDDTEFLIAEFEYDLHTYLMVVSKDPFDYHYLLINTYTYPEQWAKITELTPVKSNGEENTTLGNGYLARILPPGGYRIFKFLTDQPTLIVPID